MKKIGDDGKLVPVERTPRYRPQGDSEFRDTLLAVFECFDGHPMQTGVVLAYLVDGMDTLAKCSVSPSAKQMAASYADAARDYVPADAAELMRKGKEAHAKRS